MTSLQLRPLSPSFGVEVTGVAPDEPPSAELAAELRAAFHEHKLLLFRGHSLTNEQHVDFIRALGIAPIMDELSNGGTVGWVTNRDVSSVAADRVVDGSGCRLLWHADYEFAEQGPILLISLYALDDNESTAPTIFADMTRAVGRLSADLRARLEQLSVQKVKDFTTGGGDGMDRRCRISEMVPDPLWFGSEHGMIEPHPVTGTPYVTVSQMMTSHVVGLSDTESDELFDAIEAAAYTDENTLSHAWAPKDLIVWDNVALQHTRDVIADEGLRALRRVTADPVDMAQRMTDLSPTWGEDLAARNRAFAGIQHD